MVPSVPLQSICHFGAWSPESRAYRPGCRAVGPYSGVPWGRLRRRARACVSGASCSNRTEVAVGHGRGHGRGSCDARALVLPLLRADLPLHQVERRALQRLCALLGQPELCPRREQSDVSQSSSGIAITLHEECALGSISLALGALLAAAGPVPRAPACECARAGANTECGRSPAGPRSLHREEAAEAKTAETSDSKRRRLVETMVVSYLAGILQRWPPALSVVHALLSGWPVFSQLHALLGGVAVARRTAGLFKEGGGAAMGLVRRAAGSMAALAHCAPQGLITPGSGVSSSRSVNGSGMQGELLLPPAVGGATARACLCSALASLARSIPNTLWLTTSGSWRWLASGQRRVVEMAGPLVNKLVYFQAPALGNDAWPLDFFLHAITVDACLGACAAAAGLRGGLHSAESWASAVWPLLRTGSAVGPRPAALTGAVSPAGRRLAWATLLSDDVRNPRRFQQWLHALTVLRWSIARSASGLSNEARSRPFLVICDRGRTPPALLRTLGRHGLIPTAVNELHSPPLPGPSQRADLSLGWLRLHLWRMTEYERIVYIDADCVVVGSLEPLFALPPSVHLAAAALGPERLQNLNVGVMSLVPDEEVFHAMRSALATGTLHGHPEFRRGGFLDQAWLDLFFHWHSALPRGGRVLWDRVALIGPSHFGSLAVESTVCPPSAASLAHKTQLFKAVSSGVGSPSGGAPLGVCLLDPGFNFLVSFPAFNWQDEEGVAPHESCAEALGAEGIGLRVLHWPGDIWKPWDRYTGVPWSRSVADELWWSALGEALTESTRVGEALGAGASAVE